MILIRTPDGVRHPVGLLPSGEPDFATYSPTLATQRILREAYDAGDWEPAPAPEPQPEPAPEARWLEFYNSLIMSAPYHHIRELAKTNIQVNLFYTDLAGNLTAAIAGMPNPTGFQFTYNDLKSALTGIDAGLTQEELDTLQTLGNSCNIPIEW